MSTGMSSYAAPASSRHTSTVATYGDTAEPYTFTMPPAICLACCQLGLRLDRLRSRRGGDHFMEVITNSQQQVSWKLPVVMETTERSERVKFSLQFRVHLLWFLIMLSLSCWYSPPSKKSGAHTSRFLKKPIDFNSFRFIKNSSNIYICNINKFTIKINYLINLIIFIHYRKYWCFYIYLYIGYSSESEIHPFLMGVGGCMTHLVAYSQKSIINEISFLFFINIYLPAQEMQLQIVNDVDLSLLYK